MKHCNTSPLLAVVCATLVFSVPLNAQERLGRQANLGQAELQDIKAAIVALGGRVIIGFKPVDAERGVRADGSPVLAQQRVVDLANRLEDGGIDVLRRFRIIPAVSAVIDSSRVDALLADPAIDYVEPDVLHEPTEFPDWESFHRAMNVQEPQVTPWGVTRVDAAGAWPITRGAGAKIGIIDSGIDEDHPDLNVVGGINVVTGGTNRSDWDDNSTICTTTHGTHVAGTVAALDNTIGVVGVAPEAELHALRVFDPENADLEVCAALTSDVIAAMQYAVDNGFQVVNMSLGSLEPSIAEGDAVAATAAAGVVIVAAAGNTGAAVEFPAAYPQALAVAATSSDDSRAPFSSRGPEIDLAAPGVDVLSALGGGGTSEMDGTSTAAPHVAGVAALVRAARPDLDVEAVREVLRSTADDIFFPGYDQFTGYGIVQASAAVQAVGAAATAMALGDNYISVYAEPGGAAVTAAIEIRNVGASGVITWSATADQPWIALNPVSGTVDDVTPTTIELTADPTGLSSDLHTGAVTITSDAGNSPIQARVRFAVAEEVVLGASQSTSGSISDGERKRYALAGAAGQLVDVLLRAWSDGWDPVLRLYRPDGETVLAMSDAAFFAGLRFNALVSGVELPEDGIYFIEVGGYADQSSGGFYVEARESGPILGVSPVYFLAVGVRAREDEDPVEFLFDVFNLSGVGSLNFEVNVQNGTWLSASPTSGVAGPFGTEAVASVVGAQAGIPRLSSHGDKPDSQPAFASDGRGLSWWNAGTGSLDRDEVQRGNVASPPTTSSLPRQTGSTTVVVRLDPSVAGVNQGGPPVWDEVSFESSNSWIDDFATHTTRFDFYVYSAGMTIVSHDHHYPFDVTEAPGGRAFATTDDGEGTVYAFASDGSIEATVAMNLGQVKGLVRGDDGNLYVCDGNDPAILRVFPDGSSEVFALLPDLPWGITRGEAGEFYASLYRALAIYEISPDGSTVEILAGDLDDARVIEYNPLDGKLYVVNSANGIEVLNLDGVEERLIARNLTGGYSPGAIAVGRSGTIYAGNYFGRVYAIDPRDATADAQLIGVAPAQSATIYGMALLDGALLMSSYTSGDFYRFEVDDGPLGGIYAKLRNDAVATVEGASFSLPLSLDVRSSGFTAASYDASVSWVPSQLTFGAVTAGEFSSQNGTFSADTSLASGGEITVTATEPAGASGLTTLIDLELSVVHGAARGDTLDVGVQFTHLHGPASEDLLPQLTVTAATICVDAHPFGDPTGDGAVGALDAVQVLRSLVGLPLASGADITRADVSGDGDVGVVDAAQILRYLVDLPVPADSRVDRAQVGRCGSR